MPLSEQLRDLARHTLAKKEPVYFSAEKVPVTFQTQLKQIEAGVLLVQNAVAPAYIHDVVASQEFFLQIDTMRFSAPSISSNGEEIVFPIVQSSDVSDFRREQRFTFTAEERAVCEILNPFDMRTTLKRDVIEISSSGLSIRNYYDSLLFAPGTDLPSLHVTINGEHYLSQGGRVVYSRHLMNLRGESFFQAGIKFYSWPS